VIPPHWTRWTATDYGYAAPFCHLAFARSPKREIYVYREIYAAGLRDRDQVREITRRNREERELLGIDEGVRLYARHIGDPSMFARREESNEPSIANVYRAGGIALEPGINNRKHGWSVVRDGLAWTDDRPPRVRVFRGRCPNLVRTLPSMVHDPLDPEDLADAIKGVKSEDHAVDAFRYGLVAEAQHASPGVRDVMVS